MFEFIIFVGVCSLPFVGLYLWWRGSKRKSADTSQSKIETTDKVLLHGHDLSKWNYLGYTRCSYVDENGKTTGEYSIFLFADKNNDKRRSYHIWNDTSGYVDKSHSFVNKYIKPWAAGEGEVYYRVHGEHSHPSDYLKQYMLDRFSAEWDDSTHWWGTSDKAKYAAAQNKQKEERNVKEDDPESESNVVSVNFGKQA